jgi:hypothetical protein
VKSILRDKKSGCYYDGNGFETSYQSKAKVIDGPLALTTVCGIFCRDVEILSAPGRCVYTYQHEGGNGTINIEANDVVEARKTLGTLVGSAINAAAYWALTQTETVWKHAARNVR